MKKFDVEKINKTGNGFVVKVKETIDERTAKELKAGERMLVDSDHLAFVYILESETDLYYVSFPKATWNELNQACQKKESVHLDLENGIIIPLSNICEELAYLSDNIEGNSNYGEMMEQAVQEVFGQYT